MPAQRLYLLVLAAILLILNIFGQSNLPRVPDATAPNANSNLNRDHAPDPQPNQRVRGEVIFSDGNPPPQLVDLNATCPTSSRLLAIVDSKGKFSFSFDETRISDIALTGGCVLTANLEGYRSQTVSLANLLTKSGRNLGSVVLQQMSTDRSGLTSSRDNLVSAQQKKRFYKSVDKASRQDWSGAEAILQELTSEYPEYSSAWLNLGICQQIQGHLAEAEKSYLNAIHADPKFARPFIRAAALETSSGDLQAALMHSQNAIDLNATAFPEAYSLNAVANLSLQHSHAAEESARAGLTLDISHRYPELEYTLGTVLSNRNERTAAIEHLQRYLEQSPNGPNVESARTQLAHLRQAAEAARRLTLSADAQTAGPSKLILTAKPPAFVHQLQDINAPLLTNPSAYTCLESIAPSTTDIRGQVHPLETTRVEVAVSKGREIYGPADGKQFLNSAQRDLLGYSFNTTGLFSSIAHLVIDGTQPLIKPAGQFLWNGESVLRYDFHSLAGTAAWRVAYGSETGNAAEEGWFLVDAKSLILLEVFVKATNIPNNLKLMHLSTLIDYEPETLAGHRVLLPVSAKVEVEEQSGLQRVSLISFDHCRTFTADSTISFVDTSLDPNRQNDSSADQTRLPVGAKVFVSLTSPLSLATAVDNDILTVAITQPVLVNGHELVAKGAAIEGHVRLKHGENALIVQFDRVQTLFGWAPFYAQLLSLGTRATASVGEEQEVPGVATINFSTKSAELPAGTLMLWRTEPLLPTSTNR